MIWVCLKMEYTTNLLMRTYVEYDLGKALFSDKTNVRSFVELWRSSDKEMMIPIVDQQENCMLKRSGGVKMVRFQYDQGSKELPTRFWFSNIYCSQTYAGWWLSLPLWKIWLRQLGFSEIPSEWKVIKFHGSSHHQADHHHIPIVVGL